MKKRTQPTADFSRFLLGRFQGAILDVVIDDSVHPDFADNIVLHRSLEHCWCSRFQFKQEAPTLEDVHALLLEYFSSLDGWRCEEEDIRIDSGDGTLWGDVFYVDHDVFSLFGFYEKDPDGNKTNVLNVSINPHIA